MRQVLDFNSSLSWGSQASLSLSVLEFPAGKTWKMGFYPSLPFQLTQFSLSPTDGTSHQGWSWIWIIPHFTGFISEWWEFRKQSWILGLTPLLCFSEVWVFGPLRYEQIIQIFTQILLLFCLNCSLFIGLKSWEMKTLKEMISPEIMEWKGTKNDGRNLKTTSPTFSLDWDCLNCLNFQHFTGNSPFSGISGKAQRDEVTLVGCLGLQYWVW